MASFLAKRFVAQFIKSKDYVFKDRSTAISDIAKITLGLFSGSLLLGGLIEEFGFPTPDIVYDMKVAFSEDFRSFLKYGGHSKMSFKDLGAIRGYHETVEQEIIIEKYPANQRRIPIK